MKREPVAIYAAVVAALTAFLAIPNLGEHVSPNVRFWLGVALALLVAVGGALVRGQTTSLADPTAKDGRPLVPSPPAQVPPSPEAVERARSVLPHIKARTRTVEVRTQDDPPTPGRR